MRSFHHLELRTTDLEAARAFYEAVLDGPFDALLTELPATARRRGAPPHWLGHLFTPDVDATCAAFLAAGGQSLGPSRETDDGLRVVGLRDPWGAVVALTDRREPQVARGTPIHLSADPDAARAFYGDIGRFERIPGPGVHPQWIFPIVVQRFGAQLERLQHALVEGSSDFAYAHDPQGAAFAFCAS